MGEVVKIHKELSFGKCLLMLALGLVFLFTHSILFAEEEKKQQPAPPSFPQPPAMPGIPPQQMLSEEQRKAMQLINESRARAMQIMKERDELVKKGAPPETIQTKMKEFQDEQRRTMETLQKMGPAAMPPIFRAGPPRPRDISEFPPEQQAELKSLLEKRKEMVANSATYEDVKEITEKIRKIYFPEPTQPAQQIPSVPQKPTNVSAANAQSAVPSSQK